MLYQHTGRAGEFKRVLVLVLLAPLFSFRFRHPPKTCLSRHARRWPAFVGEGELGFADGALVWHTPAELIPSRPTRTDGVPFSVLVLKDAHSSVSHARLRTFSHPKFHPTHLAPFDLNARLRHILYTPNTPLLLRLCSCTFPALSPLRQGPWSSFVASHRYIVCTVLSHP